MKNIIKPMLLLLAVTFIGSCSNLDESAFEIKPTDGAELIYSETFADGLGKFTQKSVTGDQVWLHDASRSHAMMSGYVNATNLANEDWLISPEIDLTTVDSSYFEFDYVAHLMGNVTTDFTVWVSESYSTDSIPGDSTWIKINPKLVSDPGNYQFSTSEKINLSIFSGKKIHIAFKYLSTTTKAGTLEIKNFYVKRGIINPTSYLAGSEQYPYSTTEAMKNQLGINAWVEGYIVGYLWSGAMTKYCLGSDSCTQTTNILIADTNSVQYFAKTLPVQLPIGVVRTGLNLANNKNLIGKKVKLYGTLGAYYSVPGLKTVTYYLLADGTSGGTKPIKAIFSESFASSSQGQFTIQNVNMPTQLSYVWIPTPNYGMTASGYKSPTDYQTESWLISPSIDLSHVDSAKLIFDHALNYVSTIANKTTYVSVYVSSDYQNGLPSTGNWTPVTIPTYPAGTNWTFISSGALDLDAFAGKSNVRIAFKYVSISGDACTWEVKNVIVY